MIKQVRTQIIDVIEDSLYKAREKGAIEFERLPQIIVEVPNDKTHGDFSSNIAMQIVKQVRKPPAYIAKAIIENIDTQGTYIDRVESAGPGFINFYLNNDWLYDVLRVIYDRGNDYGRVNIGKGKKVMVEFVSANPTGPMHMGNARGAALGDSLASVLDAAGYDVTREFYINDAGNQIEKFGESLEARYLELLGREGHIPEGGYQGQDITQHMKEFIDLHGDKYLDVDPKDRKKVFVEYALKKNIDKIKSDLKKFGVEFDIWFSERTLHEGGEIDNTIEHLKNSGYTCSKEEALWFQASKFGVEKDEVLVRNNGLPTYFAADIAYHRNKFLVRNFDTVIDIWGADHHGHVARMKGAMQALGIQPDRLQVIIMQLVRLLKNGEVARMSKRKGQAVTLSDLIEEVGKDAARFFFNMRSAGSHLDFDLDLAVKQSNENPVFYVQYAYARICSIIRQIEQEGVDMPCICQVNMHRLGEPEELELMRKLADYPEEITIAANSLEPSRITRYMLDLASIFHTFYNSCRVRVEDQELMHARLALIRCTQIVIKNILDLLKITAPQKM
ncbi:MAG: arginine--tRNA ligase [Clostridia bacterium]|nr:arginine--tRNA ligase [Clostridia bacterium]